MRGSRRTPRTSLWPNCEAAWADRGGSVTLCTQNVDNLHERGGLAGACCTCTARSPRRAAMIAATSFRMTAISRSTWVAPRAGGRAACARMSCGLVKRRWRWMRFTKRSRPRDLFVSIGTSGNVYPAAGFVSAARSADIPTMEINLEPSENAHLFDTGRYGKASEQTPGLGGRDDRPRGLGGNRFRTNVLAWGYRGAGA